MADVTLLSEDSLWCRSIRHKWEWVRDELDKGTYDRIIQCERCGLAKTYTISLRTFDVIKARTGTYPDRYLTSGGRLSPREVRAEQFRRAKADKRRRGLRVARA